MKYRAAHSIAAAIRRPSLSNAELYDVTRGVWKLGDRRKRARYAMAINHGEVKEVYEINGWHRAGTTPYISQRIDPKLWRERWEFTGTRAPDAIRDKYIGHSVANYFTRVCGNPCIIRLPIMINSG